MSSDVLTIAILMVLALGLILYSVLPRRADARDAVRRRLAGRATPEPSAEARLRGSAAEQLVKRASPVLNRLVMPTSDEEQSQLRMKLASAGLRQRYAQTVFLASKTAIMAVGFIGGVIGAVVMGYQWQGIVGLATFAGGVGFLLPNTWLSMAISSRKDKIRRGLPDMLDLLVVSVESGLALDAAIKRCGDEMSLVHPELSEEFRIATMETQMGIPRAEALDHMAQRCAVEEVRSLVSVIAQAERFGTSIAKALRNQADAMRTKRRQQAEERAQKTAVKLMIPLVLFIFPAMGVVLAGPAAIRLMEAFANK